MAIGVTVLVISFLVMIIWVLVELKRFKHKLFAIFLIALILFSYLGFIASVKGKEIDFNSIDGIKSAGQLYFAWLGNIFKNFKTITSNAVQMDWKVDDNSTGVNLKIIK